MNAKRRGSGRKLAQVTVSPHTTPDESGWRASDLTAESDEVLAREFHQFYFGSVMLRLEAYRRIDAYRLKYDAADTSWVNGAEDVFDLRRKTLYGYARAWQAFEIAMGDKALSKFAKGLKAMSGGVWQEIGRAKKESWLEAARVAVAAVEGFGSGRGLAVEARKRLKQAGLLTSRRRFGPPLNFREFRHEPINEQGVVFLFGLVARDLGFLVEGVASSFPDCAAKRRVKGGLYEQVNIEFEFKASNFRLHGHDPNGCDLLVCWENDWPDCPLEVIELKTAIQNLPGS